MSKYYFKKKSRKTRVKLIVLLRQSDSLLRPPRWQSVNWASRSERRKGGHETSEEPRLSLVPKRGINWGTENDSRRWNRERNQNERDLRIYLHPPVPPTSSGGRKIESFERIEFFEKGRGRRRKTKGGTTNMCASGVRRETIFCTPHNFLRFQNRAKKKRERNGGDKRGWRDRQLPEFPGIRRGWKAPFLFFAVLPLGGPGRIESEIKAREHLFYTFCIRKIDDNSKILPSPVD